jgi:hypothetical protein
MWLVRNEMQTYYKCRWRSSSVTNRNSARTVSHCMLVPFCIEQFGNSILRFLLFLGWTVHADHGPVPDRSDPRVAELCGEVTLSFLFSLFNSAQYAVLFLHPTYSTQRTNKQVSGKVTASKFALLYYDLFFYFYCFQLLCRIYLYCWLHLTVTYSLKDIPFWGSDSRWAGKEILHSYGTRMFVAVLVRAGHCSLFWTRWIRSTSS